MLEVKVLQQQPMAVAFLRLLEASRRRRKLQAEALGVDL